MERIIRTRKSRHPLEVWRDKHGIARAALARAAGISNSAVVNIELHGSIPDVRTFAALEIASREFGDPIEIEWFLPRELTRKRA
jgi:transcriptional regulator with XRE-family HTH domain